MKERVEKEFEEVMREHLHEFLDYIELFIANESTCELTHHEIMGFFETTMNKCHRHWKLMGTFNEMMKFIKEEK